MEFSDMLARGLGRAVLHLQTHDATAYRDIILHDCTHFVGYDAQLEPSRARYNFDLITQGGDRDWYLPHLYHAFATGEDVEMPRQLFELMGLLAQDGDTLARTMMYDTFAEDAPTFDTRGAEDLVDLDGLAGYVFVARQWIKHPLPEDDQWQESHILDTVEERFGAEAVTAALAENINEDADLSAYLAQVRERRALRDVERRRPSRPPRPDYESVRNLIDAPRGQASRYRLGRAGRHADKVLMLQLADDLEAEHDPVRILHLLYCFQWQVFPLPPHRLLALAQSDDHDTAFAAQDALAHVTHPDVRAFALTQIEAGDVWRVVDMLTANPAKEDYTLIASLTQRPQPTYEFHNLGASIRAYAKAHSSPLAVPALLGLYENGPCTFCRSSVVDELAALAPLPQAIGRELAWDANMDTRTYAASSSTPS